MIYIQHTPDGIRAEREPFDGGVAYGEVPVEGFAGLRDLITDTAADLSQSKPFWTAGCLADALIKRGVTGASANNELVDALSKGGFMMTETHNVGEHRGRKLVIGFQNPDDADDAMQVIAAALTAHRKAS